MLHIYTMSALLLKGFSGTDTNQQLWLDSAGIKARVCLSLLPPILLLLVFSSRVRQIWCDSKTKCNIPVCWFPDNTAGIVTRRSGFQRRLQEVYVLPVVVEDSGYPAQSSTSTLTIRVCSCGAGGSLLACSAEAVFLPAGLSTGALMAVLLCVALLIGRLNLFIYVIKM